MSDIAYLDPHNEPADRPEWNAAWAGLLRQTGDRDYFAECPETGEVWQYLDSCLVDGRWHHQFRHRCHPGTGRRVYVHVPASRDWQPREKVRAA